MEMQMSMSCCFGGIEAGGTKFVCGVGTGPENLETMTIPTTTPVETLREAIAFLRARGGDELGAVGIGSFGPVDLRNQSPKYGFITSTPKPGWGHFDFVGAVREGLGVPVGFDTDVNAAALGEVRWGSGRGLSDFLYLTIGTGIGGGAIVHNRVLHGLMHTEMGHIPVPHDLIADPYAGNCLFHRNCLEGLACGPAIEARWGIPASKLPPDHPAWDLEARYLAFGLAIWVCTLSPLRIALGGGVMRQTHLFPRIRTELARILNGYIDAAEISEGMDEYVVPPELDGHSGLLGALVLAERAREEAKSGKAA